MFTSFPFPKLVKVRRAGSVPHFRECIPGLQPGMRIDVAIDVWFLELLVAGRLADFHVPRWQSAPTLLDTD